MVAAECRTQLSIDRLELWRYQHGSHRETIGDTLGHRDDVGLDTQPLMGKELAASSVTALDLVADQHGTVALAGISQALSELWRGHLDAAHTLDALEDDGSDTTLRQFTHPRLQVVQRQETGMVVIVDGGDDLWVVRHLDGQTRPSVECFLAREHTGVARLERSQFQGVLVGLGTGVDEKQLVVVVATYLSQSLSQFHLQFVNHGVRIEPDVLQLLRHLFNIVRVRVSDADHGMAAIQVEVFLTLVIPNLTALALHNVHVEERIYVE